MKIVVQKYGGSSVADVDKIGRVADKVAATRATGAQVVVVVSAMGKTTDELLALAHAVDECPPRRELDMLLSTGERITMALLSMALQRRGCDAISFTGSQSGIITNDRHFDARIIDVRPHRVEDELARGRVVIIAGYQGMSYKREITTLGRGGSDTTALAMAAALGAERAEIYSDVDGIYSADPRVVANAEHIDEIGYQDMQEMSEAGAKVLHAKAVDFAREAGIAIHARSSFGGARETIVRSGAASTAGVRAVVCQKGVALVHLRGDGPQVRDALPLLDTARDVAWSEVGASALVVVAQAPDWADTLDRLRARLGEGLVVQDGVAAISLVGNAFTQDSSALLATLETLRSSSLEPLRLTSGPLRLTVLLPQPAADAAVQALHDRFLGRPDP